MIIELLAAPIVFAAILGIIDTILKFVFDVIRYYYLKHHCAQTDICETSRILRNLI